MARFARGNPWSADEVAILRAHYAECGPAWVGWEALLPGRLAKAISAKASSLGIATKARAPRAARPRKAAQDKVPQTQARVPGTDTDGERDAQVSSLMAEGLTPQEIDARLHWTPGSAAATLRAMWARQAGDGTPHTA